MSQVCKQCDIDKNVSEFYLSNGCTLFKTCKLCIKAKRKKANPTPLTVWQKINPEIRAAVILSLQDRRQKIRTIADQHGINYPNLCYFVRTGQCV